jgi:hypothetical protein
MFALGEEEIVAGLDHGAVVSPAGDVEALPIVVDLGDGEVVAPAPFPGPEVWVLMPSPLLDVIPLQKEHYLE